ncbi:MAG TPA: type III secretion system export apparatus subunit SctS [Rhodocyclaceae bacterium]|nr:type III secretion system export apparatus subunit SctS [Rhodocyclaceae bacterium]
MDLATLANSVRQALWLVLLISMPPVLTVAVVGLIIAFLQGVTQIQDQTVGFALKLIAVALVLIFTGSWLGGELYVFGERMFSSIAGVR